LGLRVEGTVKTGRLDAPDFIVPFLLGEHPEMGARRTNWAGCNEFFPLESDRFPVASPAQALAAGTSDRRGRPTACPQSCRGGRSS